MILCTKCGETKARSEFSKCSGRANGLQCYCKLCDKAVTAEWQRRNPERETLRNARARANRYGLTFTLTVETLPPVPDRCQICNVELERGDENGGRNTAPSLDRLDNTRGYEPKNVWWICSACNRKKGNTDPPELYQIADAVWAEMKRRGLPLPSTEKRPKESDDV